MVQPLEDLGRYHRRQRPRQKQERQGEAHADALSAQGQGDQRSQDQLEPHRGDGEDKGHADRVPETRITNQERVVVEPDETLDTEDRHSLLKREPQHGEGRIDRERRQHHQGRGEHRDSQATLGPSARVHGLAGARAPSR
jgi:hypothetical protein